MDTVNKIEYKVRDLNTRSVVVFPTRAQVSREIQGVNLKPGTNEITVIGLSPTVEQESIKVEGNGSSAIITDIAVELLPNRDIFEEIYPDSNGQSDSDSEDDSDPEQEVEQSARVRSAKSRLREVQDRLDLANETVASAAHRLKILDLHGTTLHEKKEGVDIEAELTKYKHQRDHAFMDHVEGSKLQRDLKEQVEKIKREIIKIVRQEDKERAKEDKAKAKAREEKQLKKTLKRKREAEQKNEELRIRRERERFWPLNCYSVRVTIEHNVNTPLSSRRGSFASESDVMLVSSPRPVDTEKAAGEARCDLVLSYVTSSAGWSPSYDLQLSTTNSTAALCFDAQLTNTTSETWSNCKVVLSTSQAAFGGLDDVTPMLIPWKIKIAPKESGSRENHIIKSTEEYAHYKSWVAARHGNPAPKSRSGMFMNATLGADRHQDYQTQLMLLQQQNKNRLVMNKPVAAGFGSVNSNMASNTIMARQQQMLQQQMPQQQMQKMPQAPQAPSNVFGSSNAAQTDISLHQAAALPHLPQAAVGGSEGAPAQSWFGQSPAYPTRLAPDDGGDDGATLFPTEELDQALDFEESLMAERGFTTTYDLPGLKTLAPTSTSSKQRVARLVFSGVVLSHTIIAKYRPVANLKARIKNTSKLTLLRGLAGLTLDGSFMGRTLLPRCSAGDTFTLNLGVDPAIKVLYPKPEVRRTTTGIFSKEDSSVYVRTITMQNTRATAGKPVSIMVQDQIPVSEDERLKVELLKPQGLHVDDAGVQAGEPGRDARQDKDWGNAKATLKKSGEISWQVKLNAGKAVRLTMEYSVSLPSGDMATQCWGS